MTVAEKIYAYLRQAKGLDRKARISDFQMRVRKDAVIVKNLKTDVIRIFPVSEKDQDCF